MRNEQTDPIDVLIDEAARTLTTAEPSFALRGRVRERIARPPVSWSLVPAWGAAIAIVIAAVLAGRMLLDRAGDRVPQNNQRAAVNVPAFQQQTSAVPPEIATHAAIQPARTESRQFTRRLATPITPPPAEEESLIPPIAIEPLATAPIDAVQIAVDQSSGAMPIEIAPLRIEPLLGQ